MPQIQTCLNIEDHEVKYHAAWCVTNMGATDHVRSLVPLVPDLVRCLDLQNDVRDT